MGLGKTAEFVALVMAQKEAAAKAMLTPTVVSEDCFADNDVDDGLPCISSTLVVAPMSMLGQWQREIAAYTAGAARVRLHYGADRIRSPRDLSNCDFVLTSFGTLVSEYDGLLKNQSIAATKGTSTECHNAGRGPPPLQTSLDLARRPLDASVPILFGVRWLRVGLDEAHVIRNRSTKSARACFEIAARHRWALTGTPLQVSFFISR